MTYSKMKYNKKLYKDMKDFFDIFVTIKAFMAANF